MLGYKDASEARDCLIGKHYSDPRQRDVLIAELSQSGTFLNREWEMVRVDGSSFWVGRAKRALKFCEIQIAGSS